MEELVKNAGVLCGVFLVTGLAARLCPKNKMLGFVQGLTVLVLLVSMAGALAGVSWEWPETGGEACRNRELEEYLQDQYTLAAEEEARQYIQGLLASADIQAKKISVGIDIMEDSRIVLTEVAVWFAYESDAQRARALLHGALGEGIHIEVTVDGD